METQQTEATAAKAGMTREELDGLIRKTVTETVGPAVTAALEPLTKAQGGFFEQMLAATGRRDEGEKPFDRKAVLGKHHYGAAARALALGVLEFGSSDPDATLKAVKKNWRRTLVDPMEKYLQHVKTTLSAGVAATAGDMILPQYDEEWITLLRNNAVVRGLPGLRTKEMPRGAITQRKQTGAATAGYQGELGPMALSNLTVGRAQMTYKKLTAATIVSNDEIRFGGPDVDQTVQEDLLAVAALREDRAFLVGNPPTDIGSPQGMRYQTLGANVGATAGTSLAQFQTDFTNLIKLVQAKNLPVTPANSGFIMSVSTFWTVYNLTTTTGDWVFKAGLDQAQPSIFGFPVYLSTQLEIGNSWIGASQGLTFFAHFPSLVIWDSMARTVEVWRGGAYNDGTTVQSGISNDETVITCIGEHDFQQRYQEAVSIRTGLAT